MIEILKIKQGIQYRVEMKEAAITRYMEHLENGGEFPPIVLYYDKKDYWLADGFQRLEAHKRMGRTTIHEKAELGTERDAFIYACGANEGHGEPLTVEDKRRKVLLNLQDEEFKDDSDRMIAERCKVSHSFVAKVRSQNQVDSESTCEPRKVKGKDGIIQKVSKISKNPSKPKDPPQEYGEDDYDPNDKDTIIKEQHDLIETLQEDIKILKAENACLTITEDGAKALEEIQNLQKTIKIQKASLEAITKARDELANKVHEMNKQLMYQQKIIRQQGV